MTQLAFDFGYRKSCKTRGPIRQNVELIVDNFAGGGGASLGIEQATGRAVDLAINHDDSALTMHEFNHPATRHFCDSVWRVDPIKICKGRKVGLAWFSPDCRHYSRAKGKKPVSNKIRCLAWIVIRWARKKKPRVIMLENVREFLDWGPLLPKDKDGNQYPDPARKGESFKRWLNQLKGCGYQVEHKLLNAADFGAPTHRKRLFVIARCDGKPIKWPRPTHGPGKKPYRTAAECIDWSIPCPSIFDRKKPLADKTMRRIAMGVMRYVIKNPKPFIVRVEHSGCDHFRGQEIDKPLSTITSKNGYAVVSPSITTFYGANKPSNEFRGSSIEEPLRTQTTENRHGLVTAELAPLIVGTANTGTTGRGKYVDPANEPTKTVTSWSDKGLVAVSIQRQFGNSVGQSAEDPLGTVTAGGGGKSALVAALLTKHYGGVVGHEIDKPTGTITTQDHHAVTAAHLIKFRGDSQGVPADQPMPTVTSGAGAARPAGCPHALGIAAASLIQFNHGGKQWSSVEDPLNTVMAQSTKFGLVYAFLCKYFGCGVDQSCDDPMHTVTTKDRFSVVTVQVEGVTYAIADIGMRMLQPRELAKAQGFPDDYVLTGSKANQVAKIGNSVCPQVARALVRANY